MWHNRLKIKETLKHQLYCVDCAAGCGSFSFYWCPEARERWRERSLSGQAYRTPKLVTENTNRTEKPVVTCLPSDHCSIDKITLRSCLVIMHQNIFLLLIHSHQGEAEEERDNLFLLKGIVQINILNKKLGANINLKNGQH